MIAWLLSKLFPPKEPIYHVYRRETKKIPIRNPWVEGFHADDFKDADSFGLELFK
jgi:hypothetical protein